MQKRASGIWPCCDIMENGLSNSRESLPPGQEPTMERNTSAGPREGRPENRAFTALRELLQGGRPLIYICTDEELRAHQLLQEASHRLFGGNAPVWAWSATRGLPEPH